MATRRSDFTLTELLIVFAILVILFALLQPFLVMGREKAEAAQCANHYRQLNTVYLLYAQDWSDFFPTHSINNKGAEQYNSIEYGAVLHFLRDYLPQGPVLIDSWSKIGTMNETEYLLPLPWLCPAYARTRPNDTVTIFRPTRQGMVLLRAYGTPGEPRRFTPAGHRIGTLPSPSRYSLGAETGWEYDGNTAEEWEKHLSRPGLTRVPWFNGYNRYGHRNGWTVHFLDGHTVFRPTKRRHSSETIYGLRHRERLVLAEDL